MNAKEILEQLATLQKQVEALDNGEIVEEDGFVERIMANGDNTYVLKANAGYNANVDVLCNLEDTENGYIAYFPSYTSCEQDNYICLTYSEADYLRKLLNFIFKRNA